jgi:hypothetical protein
MHGDRANTALSAQATTLPCFCNGSNGICAPWSWRSGAWVLSPPLRLNQRPPGFFTDDYLLYLRAIGSLRPGVGSSQFDCVAGP